DAGEVAAALDGGAEARILVRQPDLPPTGRPGVPRAASRLFSVACELRHVDPDAGVRAFTGVGERLSGLVDPSQSGALAGVDHELLAAPDTVPGTPTAVLIYCMRRLPQLSHDE